MSDQEPTLKGRVLARQAAMHAERSSWMSHWRDVAEYQLPRSGRFLMEAANRGDKRHGKIIDSTAIFSHRTLAAGMMSGMTSPARPWFRMALDDKDLMEYGPVKEWLHRVVEKMRAVFAASNTYSTLQQCYEELGAFGTWAGFVRPNFENVIHHHPMTIGEYALAADDEGKVNTLVRDVKMTVGQMVKRFGAENCSQAVRNLHARGSFDVWVDVIHFAGPREEINPDKRDPKNMPVESIYIEPGGDRDVVLGESGFKRFPCLAPRWALLSSDIYGHSPGMVCLGDVKQLQHAQLRKAQAIDYQVNPPLQIPVAYKDQASKRLPGGAMFVDATAPGGGVRSAYEVTLRLDSLLEDIRDTRERIRSAYYADLFMLMASQPAGGRMTATEVAERHEEKLLMLGPVLERLHNELLSPLIDITFDRLQEAGVLPPPPPELLDEGVDIKIEFVSTLAQAQRAVAAAGTDRLLGTVGTLMSMKPDVADKVDLDQVIDEYAEMFGVPPRIIVDDDRVAAIREERAKQAAQAQAMEAAPALADTAQKASNIDPQNMRDVMNMFQGYGSPSGAEL